MADIDVLASVKGDFSPFEKQFNETFRRIDNRTVTVRADPAPLGRMTAQVSEFEKSLGAANARVAAFGASALIFGAVSESLRRLVGDSIAVEKALNQINITLKQNENGLKQFSNSLFDISKNTAQSFANVAKSAEEFSRQGLSVSEVLKRVNDAQILSRNSGLEVADSVRTITTAMNAYQKEGIDSTDVTNKIIAVSQKFAISAKDLGSALSNVSATAEQSQVPFNQLLGVMASLAKTTGQKGSEISNGLNAIFTRTRRSDTLDQLERLGVVVRDVSGNTLPIINVLQNLARAQSTASDSTKSFISELTAGVFQANRANAIYQDLAKTTGTLAQATRAAAASSGVGASTNSQQNQTISAQASRAGAGLTQVASSLGADIFGPTVKNVLGAVNTITDSVNGEGIGSKIGAEIAKGIGAVLSGPGLAIGGILVARLLAQFTTFARDAAKTVLDTSKGFGQISQVESAVLELARRNQEVNNALLSTTISRAEKEELVLSIIQRQVVASTQLKESAGQVASSIYVNRSATVSGGQFVSRAAGGIPAIHALAEVAGAKRAGYAISVADVRSMQANIGGKPTTVIYNNREKVIHNFAGTGEPAIIPPTGKIGFAGGYVPNFAEFSSGTPKELNISPKLYRSHNEKYRGLKELINDTGAFYSPNEAGVKAYHRDGNEFIEHELSENSIGYITNENKHKLAERLGVVTEEERKASKLGGQEYHAFVDRKLSNHFRKAGYDFYGLNKKSEFAAITEKAIRSFSKGYVPNFANKYSQEEINYNGALIDKSYQYIYAGENSDIPLEQRLAARKRGFEIINHADASYIAQNSEILGGNILKVIDPTAQLRDDIGGKHFKILGANSFSGDKLREAKVSKGLSQSVGLEEFTAKHGITSRKDTEAFFEAAKKEFGDNFFVKAKAGAQGKGVFSKDVAEHLFGQLPKFDKFFIQKGIENITGREFRVGLAGVGKKAELLDSPLLRGDNGRINREFISNNKVKDDIFSKAGFDTFLSRKIAASQAKRAFKSVPLEERAGAIAGLDVLETGRTGLSKLFQYAAESVGLGHLVKGGGVAELNFSQDHASVQRSGGQRGAAGSLDRGETLIKAAESLLKNRGRAFASGHIPGLEAAISREKEAGIPESSIRIAASGYLSSSSNPLGLGVYNIHDEPGGLSQGVSRAFSEGKNPKTYNVPNFAVGEPPINKFGPPTLPDTEEIRQRKIADEIFNSNEERRLANRLRPSLTRRGITSVFTETKATRGLSQHAFQASIAASFSGQIAKDAVGGQVGDFIGGASNSIGIGAGLASAIPGAGGLAIGGSVAVLGALQSAANSLTKSFEKISKESEEYVTVQQKQISSIEQFSSASANVKDLIINGGSQRAINSALSQQSLAFSGIGRDTIKKYRAATNDNDRDDVLREAAETSGENIRNKTAITEAIGQANSRSFFGINSRSLRRLGERFSPLKGADFSLTYDNEQTANKQRTSLVNSLLETTFGATLTQNQGDNLENKYLNKANANKSDAISAFRKIGFSSEDATNFLSGLSDRQAVNAAREFIDARKEQSQADTESAKRIVESTRRIHDFNLSIQAIVQTFGVQREVRNTINNSAADLAISGFSSRIRANAPFSSEITNIENDAGLKRLDVQRGLTEGQQQIDERARDQLRVFGDKQTSTFSGPEGGELEFQDIISRGLKSISKTGGIDALNDIKNLGTDNVKLNSRDEIRKSNELLATLVGEADKQNIRAAATNIAIDKQTEVLINSARDNKLINNFGGIGALTSNQDLTTVNAGRNARQQEISDRFNAGLKSARITNLSPFINSPNQIAKTSLGILQADAARQKIIGAGIQDQIKRGEIPLDEDIVPGSPGERDQRDLLDKSRAQLRNSFRYTYRSNIISSAVGLDTGLQERFNNENLAPGYDTTRNFTRINQAIGAGNFSEAGKEFGILRGISSNGGRAQIDEVVQQLKSLNVSLGGVDRQATKQVEKITGGAPPVPSPNIEPKAQEINSKINITIDGQVNTINNADDAKKVILQAIASDPTLNSIVSRMTSVESRLNGVIKNNSLQDQPQPPVSQDKPSGPTFTKNGILEG